MDNMSSLPYPLLVSGASVLYMWTASAQSARSVSLAACATVFSIQAAAFMLELWHRRRLKLLRPEPSLYCVVTGASSGIGMACARALARRGFNVLLVARRKDRLLALQEELQAAHGIKAAVLALDLSIGDGRAGVTIIDAVSSLGGFIGGIVYAAGVAHKQPFVDSPPDTIRSLLTLNAISFAGVVRAVAPQMISRRCGRILAVGSIVGTSAQPTNAVYAASKAFLRNLCDTLGFELEHHGVTVTCMQPGATTETEFAEVGHSAHSLITYLPATTATQVGEAGVAAMLLPGGCRQLVPGTVAKAFWLCGSFLPHALVAPIAAICWQPPADAFKYA